MTEQSNEEKYREILQQLVKEHFFGMKMESGYVEGVSLKEVDTKLWLKIVNEFPELLEKD